MSGPTYQNPYHVLGNDKRFARSRANSTRRHLSHRSRTLRYRRRNKASSRALQVLLWNLLIFKSNKGLALIAKLSIC
jgi:hypothetical protein